MNKQNIDSIITFIILKKLIQPFTNSKAFSLGLIDKTGKIIKTPKTQEENDALTILDKLILKLKRLLGTKLISLNKFLYLKTLNIDMYQKLIVKGNVEKQAAIIRMNKDIQSLQEKYDMSIDQILTTVLNEELKEEVL